MTNIFTIKLVEKCQCAVMLSFVEFWNNYGHFITT